MKLFILLTLGVCGSLAIPNRDKTWDTIQITHHEIFNVNFNPFNNNWQISGINDFMNIISNVQDKTSAAVSNDHDKIVVKDDTEKYFYNFYDAEENAKITPYKNADNCRENCDCIVRKNVLNDNITMIAIYSDISESCAEKISKQVSADGGVLIILAENEDLKTFNRKIAIIDYVITSNGLVRDKMNIMVVNSKTDEIFRAYTSIEVLKNHIYALVKDTKYDAAVHICETIFDENPEIPVIKQVVQQLLDDGNEQVLAFARKFNERKSDIILKNSFPQVIRSIVNEASFRIHSGKTFGALTLSSNVDYFTDRWLQYDCSTRHNEKLQNLWHFTPVWDDEVLTFRFINDYYKMDLKVDVNTVNNNTSDRLVWGDHRPVEPRFKWRLIPVAKSSFDAPLFCFVNPVYDQILKTVQCDHAKGLYTSENVKVVKDSTCTAKSGWYLSEEL